MMPVTEGLQLPQLYQKHFHHTIQPDLVAYCDPKDLVAIASDNNEIIAYRINGQIAFTIKRRTGDEASPTAISWKHDGSCLAIGWNDGTYGLYSGENGRILSYNSIRSGDDSDSSWRLDLAPDLGNDAAEDDGPVVKCFGWGTNRPREDDKRTENQQIAEKLVDTEDWFDHGDVAAENDMDGSKSVPCLSELTRAITTMDVTKALPRLSAIPPHGLRAGNDGSKFVSQAATDNIFETQKDANSTAVDTLLVCCSDGAIQILTDEIVRIGVCKVNGAASFHASYPRSSIQSVVSKLSDDSLEVSFISLPLETLGGALMHVIATNTKRVQNLVAYIMHTIRCIQHDLTAGLQFPTRLLNNMNIELEEKQEEGDVVVQLYHLAMTGEFSPIVLEWLVDIVKETNHKRWDQAINGMYTNIQNHIFVNLLPALDRLSIAITSLRGQARYHDETNKFDVPPEMFSDILDGTDSLRLAAQKIQLLVTTEQKRFKAFSKWLRIMIDIGVAGPGGKTAFETEEREIPNLDYPLLLAYISETMSKSTVRQYVEVLPNMNGSCSKDEFFRHPVISQMSYERSRRAVAHVASPEKDGDEDMDTDLRLPSVNLPTLIAHLAATVRVAMDRVTQWQSTMLSPPTTKLARTNPGGQTGIPAAFSMTTPQTAELIIPTDSTDTILWHVIHGSECLILPVTAADDRPMEILSVQGYSYQSCVLLVRDADADNQYCIVKLSLLQQSDRPHDDDGAEPTSKNSSTTVVRSFVHVFPSDETHGFKPETLIVGGRKGKRVCVVVGNSRREWRVLDLEAVDGEKGNANKGKRWDDVDDDDDSDEEMRT